MSSGSFWGRRAQLRLRRSRPEAALMHYAQVFVVPFPVKYTVCRIIIAHSFAVMVAQPPKTFKDLKKA